VSKKDALAHIVLVADQHKLSAKMIERALEAAHKKANPTDSYMRLFAYLGSILIFVGIILYSGMFWSHLTSTTRIALILAPGIAVYTLAILLPMVHKSNENLTTPLYLLAAIFQPVGLFVAVSEFSNANDLRLAMFFVFGVMFLQQLVTFWYTKKTALLFLSLFFGSLFITSGLDLMHANDKTIQVIVGLLIMTLAYFIDKTRFRNIVSFWYFVGSVIFLSGLFDAIKNTYIEGFFFLVGFSLLYLSTIVRNKALLFVSTLSTIAYIAYFTHNHFMHSAAWPMILVMMGVVCFGVGILVLKLSKKYMTPRH
jgi:uncharacterized membrane protein